MWSCVHACEHACVHVCVHVYICMSLAFSRISNLSFIFSPIISMSRSHMFLLYYCPHRSLCPRGSEDLANRWSSGNICWMILSSLLDGSEVRPISTPTCIETKSHSSNQVLLQIFWFSMAPPFLSPRPRLWNHHSWLPSCWLPHVNMLPKYLWYLLPSVQTVCKMALGSPPPMLTLARHCDLLWSKTQ